MKETKKIRVKVKKRKLKVKNLLLLILILILLGNFVYYVLNIKIKNIYVLNNELISDEKTIMGALDFIGEQIKVKENATFVLTDISELETESTVSRYLNDIVTIKEADFEGTNGYSKAGFSVGDKVNIYGFTLWHNFTKRSRCC